MLNADSVESRTKTGRIDAHTPYRRIAESFERQTLLRTLGASLSHISDGEVEIVLPFAEALRQQHGFLHAGAVATIADSACGYACLTKMPDGSAVQRVEFKINLLAPAVGERFVARGRAVRVGRTVGVATAEVFARADADERARSDPGDYRYIGSVTRGETTLSFESDKGGMQAHYLSRWVSTSGATGPWSETASATVAA